MTKNEKHKFNLRAIRQLAGSREVSTKNIIFPTAIVVSVIILDQLTKILVLGFLPTICNSGIAFGLFQNDLSIVAPIAIVAILTLFVMKHASSVLIQLGVVLVIAGGASNLIDRLFRGCVVDFINLKIWPSFNLADAAISIGVVCIIFSLIFRSGIDNSDETK